MATLHLDSPGAFFPPLKDGDQTPEFVRWAIDYECPPRESHRGDDLEVVFRQLRPLAALGEAHAEGRINSSGQAIATLNEVQYEFDAAEILNFYGAASPDEVPCLSCPANGVAHHYPSCIGILSRGPHLEPFISALERELETNLTARASIPTTSPRWYGFWSESQLHGERLKASAQLIEAALARLGTTPSPINRLLKAMRTASNREWRLHVQLLPPGVIDQGRWLIPPYCGHCGAIRAPRQRVCKICRHEKSWKSEEKRHLIGIRPYRAVKVVQ